MTSDWLRRESFWQSPWGARKQNHWLWVSFLTMGWSCRPQNAGLVTNGHRDCTLFSVNLKKSAPEWLTYLNKTRSNPWESVATGRCSVTGDTSIKGFAVGGVSIPSDIIAWSKMWGGDERSISSTLGRVSSCWGTGNFWTDRLRKFSSSITIRTWGLPVVSQGSTAQGSEASTDIVA